MLKKKFILLFACISLCYVVSNEAPNISATLLGPQPHGQMKGKGILQLPVKFKQLNNMRKRQSSDPLNNVINGYTIDSMYPPVILIPI